MAIELRTASWDDFEEAMGEKGGCGGCWCMLWRLPRKQMDAQMGDQNKAAMKEIFEQSPSPGVVAVDTSLVGNPCVGWIQVARREEFVRLETARVIKPVPGTDVWAVSCFYLKSSHRRQGLSTGLLSAACDLAASQGAKWVEGYPIDTPKKKYPPVYAWTGFLGTYLRCGFSEIERRSDTRPILRKRVEV